MPAASLEGQAPERPCDFDRCALRVERGGLLSSGTVVRGLDGAPVAEYDRSAELRELFASVDSAAAHYEAFARADVRADWVQRAGVLFSLASFGLWVTGRRDEHPVWSIGLNVAGIGFSLGARIPRAAARTALDRAVWWYNRSLLEGR